MPVRTAEEDVLQQMNAALNQTISAQSSPERFGTVMSSARFITQQTLEDITTTGGISKYDKVSKIISAVKNHIVSGSPRKVTQKFDEFVFLLRNEFQLDDLSQQLREHIVVCRSEQSPPSPPARDTPTLASEHLVDMTAPPEATDGAAVPISSPNRADSVPGHEDALTVRIVCDELGQVAHLWYKIGVQLGIPHHKLMEFKTQQDPLVDTVNYWLNGNVEDVPVSWKSVVAALESRHVGENGLAKRIRKKHCQLKEDGHKNVRVLRDMELAEDVQEIQSSKATDSETTPRSEGSVPTFSSRMETDSAEIKRPKDAEQPLFTEEDQSKMYEEKMPGVPPKKGTRNFTFLQEFCSKVEYILQTVNENEYQAVTTVLEKPGDMFDRAVIFPKNGVVLGMFAEKKTALIQTGMGTKARYSIAEAIQTFPRADVIGVGVCYAFERKKYKLGDVLVSKKICDLENMKWDSRGRVEERGQRVDVVEKLQGIFCRNLVYNPKFKVCAERNSKVYSGTIISHPSLIDNKEIRDKLHDEIRTAIGGEMEGGQLLQFQQERKVKGIIAIKGVCDYADGSKSKEWQFISALAALNYTKVKLLNEQSFEAGMIQMFKDWIRRSYHWLLPVLFASTAILCRYILYY